jgi:hypothetical protein
LPRILSLPSLPLLIQASRFPGSFSVHPYAAPGGSKSKRSVPRIFFN